jgi:hypothetical protein
VTIRASARLESQGVRGQIRTIGREIADTGGRLVPRLMPVTKAPGPDSPLAGMGAA